MQLQKHLDKHAKLDADSKMAFWAGSAWALGSSISDNVRGKVHVRASILVHWDIGIV